MQRSAFGDGALETTVIVQNYYDNDIWRECKSLPAKYAVRAGTRTMRVCWVT